MPACPWCRESLPVLGSPKACPNCAKELVDREGARLRPLDLDFEAILTEADAASWKWLRRGAVLAAVAGLAAQVPGLNVAAVLVLVVSQLFWGRFLVARRYVRHFAPVRRFVTRWISRLVVVLLVLPALSGAAIPLAGVAIAPAVFTATNWAVRAYFRFHLLREHRRAGVTWIEKVFLVLLAAVFVVLLVLFALFATAILSWLPGGK